MNIGNQIKNLRMEKKVTQEELAGYLRVSAQAVSKNIRAYEDLAYLYNHRAASDHEEASDYAKKAIALNPERKDGWVAYQEARKPRTSRTGYIPLPRSMSQLVILRLPSGIMRESLRFLQKITILTVVKVLTSFEGKLKD